MKSRDYRPHAKRSISKIQYSQLSGWAGGKPAVARLESVCLTVATQYILCCPTLPPPHPTRRVMLL